MQIQAHRLTGEEVSFEETDKTSGPFADGLPDTIVIHYTAGASAASSIRTLTDPSVKASAHVVVAGDGTITQLVPFDTVAWHAGQSRHRTRTGLNRYSIGIEIDNAGRLEKTGAGFAAWFGKVYPEEDVVEAVHRNESRPAFWHRYTEAQIGTVYDLCALLRQHYPMRWILGHEEISPGRKIDPGPAFPLDKLRQRILENDRSVEGPPEPPAEVEGHGFVTASQLNIRSGPGTTSRTVAPPLRRGTAVEVLGERGGWLEVETRVRGWVSGAYVRRGAEPT